MEPQHERRPQGWAALQALESLNPPSPSPSGSFGAFATLASTGEIPIFLHSNCAQDSPTSSSSRRPRSASFLKPSISMATFHSTNTFGHPKKVTENPGVSIPDDVSNHTAHQPSFRSSDASYLSAKLNRSGGYWDNRFSTASDFSPLTVSAYLHSCASADHLASPSGSDNGLHRPSPSVPFSVSPSESVVISPVHHDSRSPYPSQTVFDAFKFPPSTPSPAASKPHLSRRLTDISSRSWSTISSSIFRRSISSSPTSTAVSDDSTTNPGPRFRSPLLRHTSKSRSPSIHSDLGAQGHSTRSPSPQLLVNQLCDSLPVSPTSPRFRTHSASTLANVTNDSPGSGTDGALSSGNTRIHRPIQPLPDSFDLPDVLGWLRDITFELWIDQEGFRRIQPKFRLVGHISPSAASSSPNELVNALTRSTVLFHPVRRETSTYHHGTLDTLPVLRRLTLADSEDKDYISRQASLAIKTNGTYVVTGTESFEDYPLSPTGLAQVAGNMLNINSGQTDPLRLQWRFEYVVDDRKTDTGRVIPGEKTFTPLSFSCSPGLLHPSHGKRIRLMHVLMKGITPKLSAAKIASPVPVEIGSQLVSDTFKNESAWPPPNHRVKNLIRTLSGHRRTRSSEPTSAPWSPSQDKEHDWCRMRPASASAMLPQPMVTVVECAQEHSGSQLLGVPANPEAAPSRTSRQILTREELSAILASFPTPAQDVSCMTSKTIALSPPSYYRHRRVRSDLERVDEFGAVSA